MQLSCLIVFAALVHIAALPVFSPAMLNLNTPVKAKETVAALQEQIKGLEIENSRLKTSLASISTVVKDVMAEEDTASVSDLTLALAAIPAGFGASAGSCTNGGLSPGLSTITIQSSGKSRSFDINVPEGLKDGETHKTMFMWHGIASNPAKVQAFTDFNAKGAAKDWFVVYPVGTGFIKGFNGAGCCPGVRSDDTQFAKDIVQYLKDNTCVDPNYIFTTGFSNGGFMTNRLACETADLFKGFAVHSGSIGKSFECQPSKGTAVLLIHGDADPTVPYYGNNQWLSYEEVVDHWAKHNECDLTKAMNSFETSTTTCVRVDLCGRDDVPLEYCTVAGLGHKWSGEERADVDASDYIIDFFDAL